MIYLIKKDYAPFSKTETGKCLSIDGRECYFNKLESCFGKGCRSIFGHKCFPVATPQEINIYRYKNKLLVHRIDYKILHRRYITRCPFKFDLYVGLGCIKCEHLYKDFFDGCYVWCSYPDDIPGVKV